MLHSYRTFSRVEPSVGLGILKGMNVGERRKVKQGDERAESAKQRKGRKKEVSIAPSPTSSGGHSLSLSIPLSFSADQTPFIPLGSTPASFRPRDTPKASTINSSFRRFSFRWVVVRVGAGAQLQLLTKYFPSSYVKLTDLQGKTVGNNCGLHQSLC